MPSRPTRRVPSGTLRPEEIDLAAKGKNVESLKKSRAIREEFLLRFGQIPSSILRYDRRMDIEDPVISEHGRSYTETFTPTSKDFSDPTAFLKEHNFHISGSGVKKGALSTFPHNIGRIVIEVLSERGDIIYDPFAGHNSRMQLCFEAWRNYWGVDVCIEFMTHNRVLADYLMTGQYKDSPFQERNPCEIRLFVGSSNNVPFGDSLADFTITSPPYWDVEYYGDEAEQLGNCKTYKSFLMHLLDHMNENYRVLKPGAFCCWFINDFRRKGIFYPYHIDVFRLLEQAGFMPWNIYIVDLGSSLGECFLQKIMETKIFAKRHEYCVVVRKPQ